MHGVVTLNLLQLAHFLFAMLSPKCTGATSQGRLIHRHSLGFCVAHMEIGSLPRAGKKGLRRRWRAFSRGPARRRSRPQPCPCGLVCEWLSHVTACPPPQLSELSLRPAFDFACPRLLAMTSLAPCVQQVLLEAAANEARFDEARPLPVAWDRDVDAVASVGPADVRPVRRRLRAKMSPPVAWQDAGPWQPQRSPVEPAARPGAARKKPARRTRPNEECPGASAEEPCIFAQKEAALGGPACLDHGRQQQRCVWCDVAELRAAAGEPHRRKFLTRALRTWTDHGRQDVVDAAMGRLEPEARALLEAALHRAPRTQAAMAARKAAAEAAQSWGKLLEARVAVDPPLTEPVKASYRRHLAEDRRRLQAKLPEALAADADGEP